VSIPIAITVFWVLIAVGLFGLARLLIARRALDNDWMPLARFGHALQKVIQSHGHDADAIATMRELAPRMRAQMLAFARSRKNGDAPDPFGEIDVMGRGLVPDASDAEVEAGRLALEAMRGQVLAYESFLQSEMKVLGRVTTHPGHWLAAGARGLMLLPYGLALGGNVEQRARRRDLEVDPRLIGLANVVLVVLAVATVAAVAALAAEALALLRAAATR
jgi:hypothetical protein